MASYSTHRLGKVRENYVFNRHRVGKFSSHQLIRLREAYKWQAHALNKILENLPQGLNLDACRGVGACGGTDSVYMEDEDMEGFLAQSSSSQRSSGKLGPDDLSFDKNEHISLLIPAEFLASYLIPPLTFPEEQDTLLDNIPSTSKQCLQRGRGNCIAVSPEKYCHSRKSSNCSNLRYADEDV